MEDKHTSQPTPQPCLGLFTLCFVFFQVILFHCCRARSQCCFPVFISPSWASKDVVWSNMLEKDKTYSRDVHMMEKHPHLQPKMRAILLDWLMEVCAPVFLDVCLKSHKGDF